MNFELTSRAGLADGALSVSVMNCLPTNMGGCIFHPHLRCCFIVIAHVTVIFVQFNKSKMPRYDRCSFDYLIKCNLELVYFLSLPPFTSKLNFTLAIMNKEYLSYLVSFLVLSWNSVRTTGDLPNSSFKWRSSSWTGYSTLAQQGNVRKREENYGKTYLQWSEYISNFLTYDECGGFPSPAIFKNRIA